MLNKKNKKTKKKKVLNDNKSLELLQKESLQQQRQMIKLNNLYTDNSIKIVSLKQKIWELNNDFYYDQTDNYCCLNCFFNENDNSSIDKTDEKLEKIKMQYICKLNEIERNYLFYQEVLLMRLESQEKIINELQYKLKKCLSKSYMNAEDVTLIEWTVIENYTSDVEIDTMKTKNNIDNDDKFDTNGDLNKEIDDEQYEKTSINTQTHSVNNENNISTKDN